jgi:IS5 family transposase
MRISREQHISLFCQYSDHAFSEDLSTLSKVLDRHPEVCDWVLGDLEAGTEGRGAKGMSAEEVVRAAILKQVHQWTYRELEYHLRDSKDAKAFVRLREGQAYATSTLQANIKGIRATTWERINREVLLVVAKEQKIENGRQVRVDSTVAPTNIHYPRDSRLLEDCIRVLNRIQKHLVAAGIPLPRLVFSYKKAKKLQLEIVNAKNEEERLPVYKTLIEGTGDDWNQIVDYLAVCEEYATLDNPHALRLMELHALMEGIIAQTISRVIDGKGVSAGEKVVSIFEDHTDVIVKSRRETEFGHKLFFTTGKSNLVLDCKIPNGNPADATMFMEMVQALKEIYKKPPRQISADGGFASIENVQNAKGAGIKDVCFTKRVTLKIEDLVKSSWVYEKLKAFRAGIESNISALKRAFGLGRVLWRGRDGYDSYVWTNIVAYNCVVLMAAMR